MEFTPVIDWGKVVPVEMMKGDDDEDTLLLHELLMEAKNYLQLYDWCKKIKECFFGMGVGGIFSVFLFHIDYDIPCADDYVWVVVGDIPPLYITVGEAQNPAAALDGYIGVMNAWAEAAINGQPVNDLAPVNAPATKENGIDLKKRLDFLDREIICHFQDDLQN